MCEMEDRYNEILAELKNVQQETMKLELELNEIKDGYIYNATLRSYGFSKKMTFNNYESLRIYSNHYNGDNGVVVVQTNNPELVDCDFGGLKFEPLKK